MRCGRRSRAASGRRPLVAKPTLVPADVLEIAEERRIRLGDAGRILDQQAWHPERKNRRGHRDAVVVEGRKAQDPARCRSESGLEPRERPSRPQHPPRPASAAPPGPRSGRSPCSAGVRSPERRSLHRPGRPARPAPGTASGKSVAAMSAPACGPSGAGGHDPRRPAPQGEPQAFEGGQGLRVGVVRGPGEALHHDPPARGPRGGEDGQARGVVARRRVARDDRCSARGPQDGAGRDPVTEELTAFRASSARRAPKRPAPSAEPRDLPRRRHRPGAEPRRTATSAKRRWRRGRSGGSRPRSRGEGSLRRRGTSWPPPPKPGRRRALGSAAAGAGRSPSAETGPALRRQRPPGTARPSPSPPCPARPARRPAPAADRKPPVPAVSRGSRPPSPPGSGRASACRCSREAGRSRPRSRTSPPRGAPCWWRSSTRGREPFPRPIWRAERQDSPPVTLPPEGRFRQSVLETCRS